MIKILTKLNFKVMKKFSIFAAIAALAVSINSANTITLGDEVRIHPNKLGGYHLVTASMTVDGMLDDWSMNVAFPDGITPKLVSGITPLEGMTVSYTDRFGEEQTYEAPLQVSAGYATISSHIAVQGYWDYDSDGYYEPYGTAKWTAGDRDLFTLNLFIPVDFREGNIIFDGVLTSGSDQRGAVLQGVKFYSKTHVWVGYERGDVNGDGRINITDATILVAYLLDGDEDYLDEFSLKAADVNGDGEVNITDATRLIGMI